jgi:hypothetical protein
LFHWMVPTRPNVMVNWGWRIASWALKILRFTRVWTRMRDVLVSSWSSWWYSG